ncbi:MAG: acyloxyacyl hydrolase [Pseudomonadota bacterium]
MMPGLKCAFGAAVTLACSPATAQVRTDAEIGAGIYDHGVVRPFRKTLPPGLIYGGQAEGGTADAQIIYRSRPLAVALKPRLTAKLQVNTGGKTSFASVGAEWRQHVLKRRIYGQIGIGLTIHDGYTAIPDPFDFAPGSADFMKRYDLYATRTNFGSRILFNPNLSVGVRVNPRWAIEASLEHFSHNNWFGRVNEGMDTLGLRLVRTLGPRRP